jgi:hypothetical protein
MDVPETEAAVVVLAVFVAVNFLFLLMSGERMLIGTVADGCIGSIRGVVLLPLQFAGSRLHRHLSR